MRTPEVGKEKRVGQENVLRPACISIMGYATTGSIPNCQKKVFTHLANSGYNVVMSEERKKPGPPKTKGKDPLRSLRVPDEEWERWKRAASKKKLTLSMWIREIANRNAR